MYFKRPHAASRITATWIDLFFYMRTVPFQIPLLLGHAFVSLFSCLFSHKHGSRQDGAVDLTVREGGGSGVGV